MTNSSGKQEKDSKALRKRHFCILCRSDTHYQSIFCFHTINMKSTTTCVDVDTACVQLLLLDTRIADEIVRCKQLETYQLKTSKINKFSYNWVVEFFFLIMNRKIIKFYNKTMLSFFMCSN